MEVEKTTATTPAVSTKDITAAEMYIRGDDVRYIARTLHLSEDAVRNAIDRAVSIHEPTAEKLNVARADIQSVLRRVNDALDSGQVKYNSQAFHSLLGKQMQARAMLDKYNGLDNPPERPRLSITLSDMVRIHEGHQQAPDDLDVQVEVLQQHLNEREAHDPRHRRRFEDNEDEIVEAEVVEEATDVV